MAITLSQLKPAAGSKHRAKRVGRGNASGHGTYSTRGMKGQRARSGSRKGLKLKGMKARLLTIPKKRGFNSPYPKHQIINVSDLNRLADGAVVTRKLLAERLLI
ncbi:MAG: uL15 family ribosomal protein, partial [Patescibacteria group bacterium]